MMKKVRKIVVMNKEELIKMIDSIADLQKSLSDNETLDIIIGKTGNATLHVKVTRYFTRLLINKSIIVKKENINDVIKVLQMLQSTEVGKFLLEKLG